MNHDNSKMVALKIVIIYLVLGSTWILFSDQAARLIADSDTRLLVSIVKGWVFVAFTACILYGLISFYIKKIYRVQYQERQAQTELLAVHEELVASDEELRMQFEELNSSSSKLSQQNVVLEALHETALALMDRRNVDELLSKLVLAVTKLANTEHGYYNAVDFQTGLIERKVGYGIYAGDVGHKISIADCLVDGLIAEVFRTGENQIIADYRQLNNRLHGSFFDQIRSTMQLPLKIGGQIIGVIGLSYVEPEKKFSSLDVEKFDHFVEIAVLALDNASQYEQLQQEISERIKAEEQARLSEGERKQAAEELQLWGLIFENTGDSIFLTDAACCVVAVNHSFQISTGYQSNDILHQQPPIFEFTHQNENFKSQLNKLLGDYNFWQGELWVRRKDGSQFPAFVSIGCMCNVDGEISHYFITFFDISEKKAAEQRIHDLVNFDILTSLPNRRLLKERMAVAIEQCQSKHSTLAVLFIDLDRFKTVNDSLGHDMGDLLLKEMGRRLSRSISRDDIVSRQNADEFIIVLTCIADSNQAKQVAVKLLETVATPCVIDGVEVVTGATIGISFYPSDGEDPAKLLKNAEAAMIYAKEISCGGYQVFTDELNNTIAERLEIENNLRKAIYNDEFVLYYQPQIDSITEEVVGVEALIRWQNPEQGLIAPGKFIAIAEATGLIIPIGEWVLKEVCRQSQLWQQQGLQIPIAVNISAVQFMQVDFCNMIEMILVRTGMEPHLLEIELTESVIMKEADQTINELKRLKELGIRLSIDDFGTGYSSLSYLRRFPIDKLKIDQSFVRHMTIDKASLAIIEAIIALGSSLDLTVIAEGVETEQELAMLRQRNCPEIQGYYFAYPMPTDQLTGWLTQRKLCSRK